MTVGLGRLLEGVTIFIDPCIANDGRATNGSPAFRAFGVVLPDHLKCSHQQVLDRGFPGKRSTSFSNHRGQIALLWGMLDAVKVVALFFDLVDGCCYHQV